MMELHFHKGTIQVKGNHNLPHTKWDKRANSFRAEAFYYNDMIEYLKKSNIQHENNVLDLVSSPDFKSNIKLRDYQGDAVKQWLITKKGTIVLPTGSGKTIITMKIIETINSSAFIVVPTLDLVNQWKETLKKSFNVKIGEFTGNKKDIQSITISTYHSAFINAQYLGNKFKLLIFDEVHHLPSESFIQIAEMFASPYRLGLTATYDREDGLQEELPRLIGGIVYEKQVDDLKGKYLSNHAKLKILIDLTEPERKEYDENIKVFKNYLISNDIRFSSSSDYQKLVMRSGNDPKARKAIIARNRAVNIAYNSKNKIEKLKELLNKEDRILIFTRYNNMVYEVSRMFLIPCITYQTNKKERKDILKKFKKGIYTVIISSQVLDEGIDLPEANIGIILSGTGSKREYTQRLGRLLRPREGKKAILYEIVSKNTMEVKTSNRRKK